MQGNNDARQDPACMQGLEHTDLMVLKPPPPPKQDAAAAAGLVPGMQGGAKLAPAPAESFLGRRSGGACLAFLGGKDGREYLVGAASSPFSPRRPSLVSLTHMQTLSPPVIVLKAWDLPALLQPDVCTCKCSTMFTSLILPHPACAAGTDDGHIHQCSLGSADSYLATYRGHLGAVYALRGSPCLEGAFLSASADCSVRLWREGQVWCCDLYLNP
jgi:hypothetical protein